MACGIVYRLRKLTAKWLKTVLLVSLIAFAVINVSFPAVVFSRSASYRHRFPASVSSALSSSSSSSAGEIRPQSIRSLSDISNSELLRFILSNGTGDISQGGRMPVQIIEPFIERMQGVEESERIREKSLKAVSKALLEEQSRKKRKKKKGERKGGIDEEEEDVMNRDDANNEKLTADSVSIAKLIKDFFLNRDGKLDLNKKDPSDDAMVSLLVKRLLANAIVKPPPPLLSPSSSPSSTPPPSSSLLLLSSSSSHTSSKTQPQQNYSNRNESDNDYNNNNNNEINDDIKASDKERIRETVTIKQQRPVQGRKDGKTSNGQEPANVSHAASNSNSKTGNNNVKQTESYCDENKTALVGRIRVQIGVLNLTQVLSSSDLQTDVDPGGHFRPRGCVARERVAIVIPFRDREQHLATLLEHLFPVLKRQRVDFTFFVIEENKPTPFNRAMLFNIGFLEASKLSNFDCFIFHDVDLIPINDRNIYECNKKRPIHFLTGVNKYKYRLPYRRLFGGVVAFTKTQFLAINGASNLFFGWGGEDDDLRNRSVKMFKGVSRKNRTVGLYDMIRHKGASANPVRYAVLRNNVDRQDIEGLNTTKYIVTSRQLYPLFTKISVNISFEQVLKTAPADLLPEMQALKAAFSPSGELLSKPPKLPAEAKNKNKLNTTTNNKITATKTNNVGQPTLDENIPKTKNKGQRKL